MNTRTICGVLIGLAAALFALFPAQAEQPTAGQILQTTGATGGLVVHVGCGDGKLTAALRANDRYLVHGLESEPANVERARRHARSLGLYGKVSIQHWTPGRLPYAENLVNLLVVEDPSAVSAEEMLRVLVPDGVAYCNKDGRWTKTVKPCPDQIDEWTHWLHGPDGNAVAQDDVVGPPRRLQWAARPFWSRHHNLMPSISAMVSSGGRLFCIIDDAPAAMEGTTPDKWALVASDAFNGIELWRIPIAHWGWKAWSGRWEGRFNQPNHVPKRLVAVGQTVYATLGFNAPLVAIDAATGRIKQTYEGTQWTDEIIYDNGTLILSVNQAAQGPGTIQEKPPEKKSVFAMDAKSGEQLWETRDFTGITTKTGSVERVTHLLLATRAGRVLLVDGQSIVALDKETGERLWKAPRPEVKEYRSRYYHMMSEMSTLVATDDVILFCQMEPIQKRIGWRVIRCRLQAYSAETGEILWDYVCGTWAHFSVPDVFVARGLVWVHDKESMSMAGLDLLTGQQKRRISTELAFDNGHHHRCYRNKATERYLMSSFRGLEFIDWEAGKNWLNHWVRGTCRLGAMPCNGMVYATPHPCDCYINSKLNGILALGPAPASPEEPRPDMHRGRWQRGPAYAQISNHKSPITNPHDWPTYRHDPARSGHAGCAVPADLKPAWKARLSGRLTAPVVADGRVFVATFDTHAVYGLRAATGEVIWQTTADGPVDSPPTFHDGLVLFGSRDGWVYCLRSNDGRLAWRRQVAPEQRLVGAFGGLESAWPVFGSVLVQNGRAYVTAGRSSFLDGGIFAYVLDPTTGKVLERRQLADDHNVKADWGRDQTIDWGLVADVLVGDGKNVFLRQRCLFGDAKADGRFGTHLRATAGMLDDSWFNRTVWTIDGNAFGEYLVYDEQTAYAPRVFKDRGHGGFFLPESEGYELIAAERKATPQRPTTTRWSTPRDPRWSIRVPVRPTSLLVAGDVLFSAGTPDAMDEDDPWAVYEGRRGGALLAISATDGRMLARYSLDEAPGFDSLAAARGQLFVSTRAGTMICYRKAEK